MGGLERKTSDAIESEQSSPKRIPKVSPRVSLVSLRVEHIGCLGPAQGERRGEFISIFDFVSLLVCSSVDNLDATQTHSDQKQEG